MHPRAKGESRMPIRAVDRLSASRIIIALGLEPNEEQLESVARHLSEHRENGENWGSKQARDKVSQAIANHLLNRSHHHSEEWCDGLREAEMLVSTLTQDDILEVDNGHAPSRGTILRSMIRNARKNFENEVSRQ